MAFQAGVLNTAGFIACHRFVSHVTGFATFFGIEVSRAEWGHAAGMLTVPLVFMCGSMLSGQLVDIPLKRERVPKYYIVFGLMSALLGFILIAGQAGTFGYFGKPLTDFQDYLLIALLCLICGLQNGTITSVSKAVVRTTHLTGITTDLGIGIVRVLNRHRLKNPVTDDIHANWMRIGIIFSFGFGAVVGALLFTSVEFNGFFLPLAISGFLFLNALYQQKLRKPAT